MSLLHKTIAATTTAAVGGAGIYLGLITGTVPIDLGIGRRTRRLGPQVVEIEAPREVVFDIVAAPYAERTSRVMQEKVQVLARGSDLVLAAHRTAIGRRLAATTVETVRFVRPERIEFGLVRGPVPHVAETFELDERNGRTTLTYTGELGTDLWGLGERWGDVVTPKWEATVRSSLEDVKAEAERRTP